MHPAVPFALPTYILDTCLEFHPPEFHPLPRPFLGAPFPRAISRF